MQAYLREDQLAEYAENSSFESRERAQKLAAGYAKMLSPTNGLGLFGYQHSCRADPKGLKSIVSRYLVYHLRPFLTTFTTWFCIKYVRRTFRGADGWSGRMEGSLPALPTRKVG
eukprot:scaffold12351_cov141-Skeletonema_menzelii.AAC.11